MGGHYHHATDDMQPCYLPDGGMAFISTRCQFGILCDTPDDFTTTVLYRMDGDGYSALTRGHASSNSLSWAMCGGNGIMIRHKELQYSVPGKIGARASGLYRRKFLAKAW